MEQTLRAIEDTHRLNEQTRAQRPGKTFRDPTAEIRNTLKTVNEINRLNQLNRELQQRRQPIPALPPAD